jgi:hypothetical protein
MTALPESDLRARSRREDFRIWHGLCTSLFFMWIRDTWRTSELRGGWHGRTKIAILLLSVPLLVVGGYVASTGKGISLGVNGASAAPQDDSPGPSAPGDEPDDISPAEPEDQQRVEEAREAYYMMVFDADGGAPRSSHTFATFVKATGKGSKEEDDQLEAHTISWMPESLEIAVLRRTPEPGVNLDLSATLRWARWVGARISMWGPYRIGKELYDRALTQEERLRSGRVQYKAIDRNYRPQASNCIHALSDIDTDNGFLHVGPEWGEAASRDVANYLRRWVINPEKTYPWVSERLELKDFLIEGQRLEEVSP